MAISPQKGNYTTLTPTISNEREIWWFRLFGLFALLAAFSAAAFSQGASLPGRNGCTSAIAPHQLNPKFISKAGRVKGIIEELSKSRDRFVATGDLVDLFPTLYVHTTKALFERAIVDESPKAEIALDMIIAFYDAYAMNRRDFDAKGSNAVEPHWRAYYRGAVKANRSRSVSATTIAALLLDGVDAHVAYDLPRATRFILSSNVIDRSVLKAEFDKMNIAFKAAAASAHKDVAAARTVWNKFASLDILLGLGVKYVIFGRGQAWELAVSEKKLPTKRRHPVLPNPSHDSLWVADDITGCRSLGRIPEYKTPF